MRTFKIILAVFVIMTVLWIDLPEYYPVKFSIGKKKFDFVLKPPTISYMQGDRKIEKDFKTYLGLDLSGGSHLVFEADTSKIKSEDLQDAINSARDIIERRVNLFGVSEPTVQTIKSGKSHRISVDLPGIEDVSQAVGLIGATAQLTFKEEGNLDPKIASTTPEIYKLNKETGLTGADVKKATVTFNNQNGEPEVTLQFNQRGAKLFGEVTSRNVKKQVGIFLDYYPLSAPVVQQPILDGNAVISGNFTVEGAKQLAIAINSGALPVPIKIVEQRNIGPTIGAIEVQKSLYAGIVGLGLVLAFMIMYYGRLGIIASMALIVYGLISFALFRSVPVVLTLPGVAGFILSIGMAVDSNILIFERIKEEQRKGKSTEIAVRLGFGKAISAIKDANVTTLLIAFILFNPLNWEFLPQFGLVRGFALTLAIGVGTSLFTGLVVTRRLIKWFYKYD